MPSVIFPWTFLGISLISLWYQISPPVNQSFEQHLLSEHCLPCDPCLCPCPSIHPEIPEIYEIPESLDLPEIDSPEIDNAAEVIISSDSSRLSSEVILLSLSSWFYQSNKLDRIPSGPVTSFGYQPIPGPVAFKQDPGPVTSFDYQPTPGPVNGPVTSFNQGPVTIDAYRPAGPVTSFNQGPVTALRYQPTPGPVNGPVTSLNQGPVTIDLYRSLGPVTSQ